MWTIEEIIEKPFVTASAKASHFELRARLRAGTIPNVRDDKINTGLSEIVEKIIVHYDKIITPYDKIFWPEDKQFLKNACQIRNKLIHCEFSAARKRLDPNGDIGRDGGVVSVKNMNGLKNSEIWDKLDQVIAGKNVGQVQISKTETKTHKDILPWLLESSQGGEFDEASKVFDTAIEILDLLSYVKVP